MAKVKVEQQTGEIILTVGGAEPRTYRVTDGLVTVAADDLDHFLATVPGSAPHRERKKPTPSAPDLSAPAGGSFTTQAASPPADPKDA